VSSPSIGLLAWRKVHTACSGEDACEHEMLVRIRWEHRKGLAVPLAQLKGVDGDEETRQTVEDWHYRVRRVTSSDWRFRKAAQLLLGRATRRAGWARPAGWRR
jgi:hypothetical protein